MSIYQSDWNPRGVRKTYDRCAISNEDAQRIFGEFGRGIIIDACGWFEENGALRILVADTDTGHRMTARTTKRNWSITIGHPDDVSRSALCEGAVARHAARARAGRVVDPARSRDGKAHRLHPPARCGCT